jgi:predicted nucleotide-binding protein (sugar kinase/HSP70/actin superfamily)
MKVAFPHMGNAYIPLRALVETLGAEAVVPERPNRVTLENGSRYAPEFVCLPFKITLGDCINALEKGADTLAMVCGMWACRFGYYARVQHLILRDLGYEFDSLLVGREDPRVIWEMFRPVVGRGAGAARKVAGALAMLRVKAGAVEELECLARKVRPRERAAGSTDALMDSYLGKLDEASSLCRVRELRKEMREALQSLPLREENGLIRVRIVGELYVLLEPSLNFDLVKRLGGYFGVEAQPVLSTYRWLLSPLWLDPLLHLSSSRARRLTRSYLPYALGGEEHMTITGTLDAFKDGYDGVIHAYPLTCMPENICRTILPHISSRMDLPLLNLCFDEHTSTVGTITRLEAFLDMLRSRRELANRATGAGKATGGREAF